jgi:2-amino-4-hydroxy-6-hydroxymethyldihydropteridine diphosphokinase
MSPSNQDTISFFVLIGIGSNLGDRAGNIRKAIEMLASRAILSNIRSASVYETEPVGFKNQPWFLNTVVSGKTKLTISELLAQCKEIERTVGRQKRPRWHEREIDLDILLYGDSQFTSEEINIPHPRMTERRFVLIPASEIAPNSIHPVTQKTIAQLLDECTDSSKVTLYP